VPVEAENAQESAEAGHGTIRSLARQGHTPGHGCDVLQGSLGRKAIEAYLGGSAEIKDVIKTFYRI